MRDGESVKEGGGWQGKRRVTILQRGEGEWAARAKGEGETKRWGRGRRRGASPRTGLHWRPLPESLPRGLRSAKPPALLRRLLPPRPGQTSPPRL